MEAVKIINYRNERDNKERQKLENLDIDELIQEVKKNSE